MKLAVLAVVHGALRQEGPEEALQPGLLGCSPGKRWGGTWLVCESAARKYSTQTLDDPAALLPESRVFGAARLLRTIGGRTELPGGLLCLSSAVAVKHRCHKRRLQWSETQFQTRKSYIQ